MTEKTIKLTGWQAALFGAILLILVGIRIATFSNNTDEDLHDAITQLLQSEFYPNQVAKLRKALAAEDEYDEEQGIDDVLEAELKIYTIQTSYPFLDFSSPRDVIVKVTYSLGHGDSIREGYYLYKYGMIGNNWQYQHTSNVVSFYLNLF